ncbi:RHS repeat-associated core domain-containing protein [Pseudomonas sp. FYR_2]|uniref:RHS repeat-associated core domain-containing protein n=2 Tax=Pseudomonas TaxID=286 RepID=UPI0018A383CD|nr:RHS repeat-associated core domain-containing protein [Pseudomonas monteilii]MBZ3663229.1 RHS repeat-associated core domain-containing protein [Pseudomonas monteilii]MBZ3668555.1 RHS repeat-associated core domain-containing protein [Pseudomonas monteilii]BBV95467.1 hypothetical protein STW0522PSE72_08180 [Pseudomonas monteilii]
MAIKLFYQQDRLALIHDVQAQRRLISTDAQAHAVLLENSPMPVLLACDVLASVLLINPQQNMKARCYSPYGHDMPHPGIPGFAGQLPETALGGYLLGNGYRLFSPVLMRFTAADDWSPFGAAGVNPYAYCKGDPVNYSDPSGHILSRLKSVLNHIGRKAVSAADSVMYEYVKAKHGERIFKGIAQLEKPPLGSRGAVVAKHTLSPADVKVGERMLDESLKFQKQNNQITQSRIQSAERGGEGSKIIFAEGKSYIVDVLTNQHVREARNIVRLEEARDNLRAYKETGRHETRLDAR